MRKSRENSIKAFPGLLVGSLDPSMGRGQEPVLLEFLDEFDFEAFLSDPTYRRRLNEILDTFTDEEFDKFEHRYARRFTLN